MCCCSILLVKTKRCRRGLRDRHRASTHRGFETVGHRNCLIGSNATNTISPPNLSSKVAAAKTNKTLDTTNWHSVSQFPSSPGFEREMKFPVALLLSTIFELNMFSTRLVRSEVYHLRPRGGSSSEASGARRVVGRHPTDNHMEDDQQLVGGKSNKGSKKREKSADRPRKAGEKKKDRHVIGILCGDLCESHSPKEKLTKKGASSPSPSASPTAKVSALYRPSEPGPDFSSAPSAPPPSATMLDVDDQLEDGFNFSSAPSDSPSGSVGDANVVPESDFNVSTAAPSNSPSSTISYVDPSHAVPSHSPSGIPSVTPTLVLSNEPSHLPSMSPTVLIASDSIDQEKDDEITPRVTQRTLVGSMVALAAAVGGGLMFHFKPRRP